MKIDQLKVSLVDYAVLSILTMTISTLSFLRFSKALVMYTKSHTINYSIFINHIFRTSVEHADCWLSGKEFQTSYDTLNENPLTKKGLHCNF